MAKASHCILFHGQRSLCSCTLCTAHCATLQLVDCITALYVVLHCFIHYTVHNVLHCNCITHCATPQCMQHYIKQCAPFTTLCTLRYIAIVLVDCATLHCTTLHNVLHSLHSVTLTLYCSKESSVEPTGKTLSWIVLICTLLKLYFDTLCVVLYLLFVFELHCIHLHTVA